MGYVYVCIIKAMDHFMYVSVLVVPLFPLSLYQRGAVWDRYIPLFAHSGQLL